MRAIQELESYFDGPLFSRSNRGVMPTDLGVLLGRRVKSLMAEFRYMTDEVNDFRLGTSGHVIVGTLIAASARLLYMSRTLNAKTALNDGHQLAAVDGGSSPTVFGLRGVEDLGGGAKVRFTLESGVSVMNGGINNSNGNFFGRQAFVSLAGKPGEVKLGLQYSPFFLSLYETDPRGFSQIGSGLVNYANNVAGTGAFNSNVA